MKLIFKSWCILMLFICLNLLSVYAQKSATDYPIIPYPKSLVAGGGNFVINGATLMKVPTHKLFGAEADVLNRYIGNCLGKPLKKVITGGRKVIELKYDAHIQADEGYQLLVTPQRVMLAARTAAGMFMGMQTIRQLLPPGAEYPMKKSLKTVELPAMTVNDEPAYAWRGMH